MGYKAEGEVLDLVNNAQAEIYSVTGSQETEDYVPLTDAVDRRDRRDRGGQATKTAR